MSLPRIENRSAALEIEYLSRASSIPDPGNARKHPKAQMVRLEAAMREFGLNVPIIIDEGQRVVAGHARLIAAETLGLDYTPCIRIAHLTPAQKRALAIADNRIAELAELAVHTSGIAVSKSLSHFCAGSLQHLLIECGVAREDVAVRFARHPGLLRLQKPVAPIAVR